MLQGEKIAYLFQGSDDSIDQLVDCSGSNPPFMIQFGSGWHPKRRVMKLVKCGLLFRELSIVKFKDFDNGK